MICSSTCLVYCLDFPALFLNSRSCFVVLVLLEFVLRSILDFSTLGDANRAAVIGLDMKTTAGKTVITVVSEFNGNNSLACSCFHIQTYYCSSVSIS